MIDYRVGDTRDLIAQLPDESVDLIASSPPFLALRSYLPADHEHKHAEIGSEPDPATFIDTLLALTADWGRVLAPHGSLAIELGDTYANNGGPSGDQRGIGLLSASRGGAMPTTGPKGRHVSQGWPRAKSLALIPQLYAIALAYGRNPLTGRESPAGQWLVRNVIVWHRPNPAVGALGDKFRPSTSYIVVATRSPKRWFDLTAVRNSESNTTRLVGGYAMVNGKPSHDVGLRSLNPAGAPPLDCWTDEHDHHDTWTLTPQPSKLAHYAMWPAKLAERLVLSMCPAEVCTTCGEPRRRMEGAEYIKLQATNNITARSEVVGVLPSVLGAHGRATKIPITLGWTDCGHDTYRPGITLDPFAGTGTTPIVAHLHGRTGIGFDLDPRNRDLVAAREAEVRRNLFDTRPELPGQLDIFGSAS